MDEIRLLVQNSRELTSHIQNKSLNQSVRGIEQIESQTNRLLKRTCSKQDSPQKKIDSKTQYLLASRGFDASKMMGNLDGLDLGLTLEPLRGIADTDIESYLRNEHESIVSLAVEESGRRAVSDFEARYQASFQKDWLKQKRKILESVGQKLYTTDPDSILGSTYPSHTFSAAGSASKGQISNHPRLNSYLKVVKDINEARLLGKQINVISAFRRIVDTASGDKQQDYISGCWNLLSKMLQTSTNNSILYGAGHFAQIYKKSILGVKSEDVDVYRTQIVKGGRQWLQDNFKTWLTLHIREHHFEIGGMPSVHDEVDAYLKIRFYRNGRWTLSWLDHSIGRVPFWAHVYTLMRMGLMKEVLAYTQKYSFELEQSRDYNFLVYVKAWINSTDGRLPNHLRDSLINEWNSRIRDFVVNAQASPKGDAFQFAIYKIIGRCDLGVKSIRNSDVAVTTDDYLWINMMLIVEDSFHSNSSPDKYNLADFSTSMQKFGNQHFQKTDVWFMVLMLCGEFEKALDVLSREQAFATDCLHLATAMAYYGIINVPDNPKVVSTLNSMISLSTQNSESVERVIFSFNFAGIITQFVEEWVQSDAVEVINYIYILGLFCKPLNGSSPNSIQVGTQYSQYVYELIRDVLMLPGLTTDLIGQLRDDGRGRIIGPIERHRTLININSEQDFQEKIILVAAQKCEKESRMKDALELYNLGCQPNKVVELLIRIISSSLQNRILKPSKQTYSNEKDSIFSETDPVDSATRILDFYSSRNFEASILNVQTVFTCRTLIILSRLKIAVNNEELEYALTLFYSLNIVPSQCEMNLVRKKAQSFDSLDESICRAIPSSLLMVSSAISTLYQQIKVSRNSEREARLMDLKQRMNAILTFSGLVQYQIPSQLFASMNRLAVMMT